MSPYLQRLLCFVNKLSALQLVDALEWCLDLGVTTVSVYAFSVDNFKRHAAEVAMLMALAREKLREILTARPGRAAQRMQLDPMLG